MKDLEEKIILKRVADPSLTPAAKERRVRGPQKGIGLCLSGGGYRAMLFHVGSLWRLLEMGYLAKLDRISSVSGGSITAATLGLHWGMLSRGNWTTQAFRRALVDPIRSVDSLSNPLTQAVGSAVKCSPCLKSASRR